MLRMEPSDGIGDLTLLLGAGDRMSRSAMRTGKDSWESILWRSGGARHGISDWRLLVCRVPRCKLFTF